MPAVTPLLMSPKNGEMLKVTAGINLLNLLAYSQQKKMHKFFKYLHLRWYGLVYSETAGNGWMGATHHFVSGEPINQKTSTAKCVLLLIFNKKECGRIEIAKTQTVSFAMVSGVFLLKDYFYYKEFVLSWYVLDLYIKTHDKLSISLFLSLQDSK